MLDDMICKPDATISIPVLIAWLTGQKYVTVDEMSDTMTEKFEKEHLWELSRNYFINKTIRELKTMENNEQIVKRKTLQRDYDGLNKEMVVFWNAVPCALHFENGHEFGIELDLFNNHQEYYDRYTENGKSIVRYLGEDVCEAIDKFNELMSHEREVTTPSR